VELHETRARLRGYEAVVTRAKVLQEIAQKALIKRQQLLSIASDGDALLAYVDQLLVDLKVIQQVTRREEIAFKQRRLGYIDGIITEGLAYIFPAKHLVARTECNFQRNNTKLQLSIIDSRGNVRPPFLTEGKFAQQLISFMAASAAITLLGKNILYLDESFSNASEDNLGKMQSLLRACIDGGNQVFMIAQSPLAFADLARREIHLMSNDGIFVDKVEYEDWG
jgi:hypothetical protein